MDKQPTNKKSLKMRIIATIGLQPWAPRWVKVFCLQLTMSEIEKGFKRVFLAIDASKITQKQREEIDGLIQKMNRARG
ncbi:TPA: hypothetical protein ACHQNL_002684 [Serratia marcescens]